MKKRLLFPLTALALAVSTPSFANTHEKDEKVNEAIGFGTGVTIGAVVGGPIGAMVGSIIGVLIADDVNDTHAYDRAQTALADKNQQLAQQKHQLVALQNRYDNAMQANAMQLVSLDKQLERVIQEIESQVLFRTASYAIEEQFKPQLNLVAKGLKDNPELVVTLSGFADSRGSDSYNQNLSKQRALSVQQYLLAQGVKPKQVVTAALGEAESDIAQATVEDHFFDRRVLVNVTQGQKAMTAANKN